MVFQDVRVLAMSLRDNLTVYNSATDEKLCEILKNVGLSGVLERVNGNLDTMVSRSLHRTESHFQAERRRN